MGIYKKVHIHCCIIKDCVYIISLFRDQVKSFMCLHEQCMVKIAGAILWVHNCSFELKLLSFRIFHGVCECVVCDSVFVQ